LRSIGCRGRCGTSLSAGLVDRALAGHHPALNSDQTTVVHHITSSGRGIESVQAVAGTGKTTMVGALADCYRAAGWHMIGAAPTARAARQLRERAGIPATTMHSLLGELERAGGFRPRTVLVLDEAGMAPTTLTAELFRIAEQGRAKLVAIGDPGQLASVQAGGWLGALCRLQGGPGLREVMRQRDPRERAALQALRDGRPEEYLTHKHNEISVHTTGLQAISVLAAQWHAAQREQGPANAVMITRDNATRDLLNQAARDPPPQDWTISVRLPGPLTVTPTLSCHDPLPELYREVVDACEEEGGVPSG
jgi:ATP-dependent exoDNAse (exonuclease V) alpha subunit